MTINQCCMLGCNMGFYAVWDCNGLSWQSRIYSTYGEAMEAYLFWESSYGI